MADQAGTPGSNADVDISVNGTKTSAPKDKSCLFCHQNFTSSSLGRHLDLYIKEKNPKQADGIHDVDEIRKLRGGITRRQPRNSASRREDSTPVDTPGMDRRSPHPDIDRHGNRSPSVRRDESGVPESFNHRGKPNFFINKGTWESTGVMNNIPVPRNSDSRSWDGEDRDGGRRIEPRSRSISKQMLAKTTFEQKQKMLDALDNARAAELALREILGSFRAAKQRIDGPSIFDYDPLTLDFPALTLHCLPPPPTLYQSTPISTTGSWSILPPNEQQYEALRGHFSAAFRRWRVSCSIANNIPRDEIGFPIESTLFELQDPNDIQQRAELEACELETKVADHLHQVFAHWNSLPPQRRSEIWTLELARSVGRKSQDVEKLKKEKEYNLQELANAKQQVDDLSRLQHPREFKISPPVTMPMDAQTMARIGELSLQHGASIGFHLTDRNVNLDTLIERAIGRWKSVVKETRGRGGGGMGGQRSLSGESAGPPPPSANQNQNTTPTIDMRHTHTNNAITNGARTEGLGSDADADADMEDEDSFVEMTDAPQQSMPNGNQNEGFRMSNGNGVGQIGLMDAQQGYVRIGA